VLQAVDGTEADDALESSLPDERAEVGGQRSGLATCSVAHTPGQT
jgi:hypothetical protein